MLHWINCNVYSQSRKTVTEKLKKYKQELSDLRHYPKAKRGHTHWSRVTKFVNDCQKLFEIKGSSERVKHKKICGKWKWLLVIMNFITTNVWHHKLAIVVQISMPNGKKHRKEKPLTTIYWKDLENLIWWGSFVLHLLLINIIHSHSKYREVKNFTTFRFQKNTKKIKL